MRLLMQFLAFVFVPLRSLIMQFFIKLSLQIIFPRLKVNTMRAHALVVTMTLWNKVKITFNLFIFVSQWASPKTTAKQRRRKSFSDRRRLLNIFEKQFSQLLHCSASNEFSVLFLFIVASAVSVNLFADCSLNRAHRVHLLAFFFCFFFFI